MRLLNKIVFVTSAQNPCADAIVTSFAREGADCFIVDDDAAAAGRLATRVRSAGRRAAGIRSDVTKKSQVEESVRSAMRRAITVSFFQYGIVKKIYPS
jgi:NAD(P)-dependent dehydrogenase (short-subunit alcohol dehydrogenase family)